MNDINFENLCRQYKICEGKYLDILRQYEGFNILDKLPKLQNLPDGWHPWFCETFTKFYPDRFEAWKNIYDDRIKVMMDVRSKINLDLITCGVIEDDEDFDLLPSQNKDVDKFLQEANEKYFPFILSKMAEKDGMLYNNDSQKFESEFLSYCKDKNIIKSFSKCLYKIACDKNIGRFWNEIKLYISSKFDGKIFIHIDHIENQGRSDAEKRDIVLQFIKDDGSVAEELSYSIKVYKNLNGIQLHSGTYQSMAACFLANDRLAVGGYEIDIGQGKVKVCSSVKEAIKFFPKNIQEMFDEFEIARKIMADLKDKWKDFFSMTYSYGNGRILNNRITGSGTKDYKQEAFNAYRNDAIKIGMDVMYRIISSIPKDHLKKVLSKCMGLDGSEELVAFSPDGKLYINSLVNHKIKYIIDSFKSPDSILSIENRGSSIVLSLIFNEKVIIEAKIAININKNGQWQFDEKPFRMEKSWKEPIKYGMIRSNKTIATSTNCWVDTNYLID